MSDLPIYSVLYKHIKEDITMLGANVIYHKLYIMYSNV